jgi:hypothetical protein
MRARGHRRRRRYPPPALGHRTAQAGGGRWGLDHPSRTASCVVSGVSAVQATSVHAFEITAGQKVLLRIAAPVITVAGECCTAMG